MLESYGWHHGVGDNGDVGDVVAAVVGVSFIDIVGEPVVSVVVGDIPEVISVEGTIIVGLITVGTGVDVVVGAFVGICVVGEGVVVGVFVGIAVGQEPIQYKVGDT